MEIVDKSECFEERDVIGYRIKKAKEKFEALEKEDLITVTINRPPEPDTLSEILRGLKREFSSKGVNKRCTEYVLAELGYRAFYKYLSRSGFLMIQKITKRIRDTIGHRLVDDYPDANFVLGLGQRDNRVRINVHVSQQQHEQLCEIGADLHISIGDALLMCMVCVFNDLNGRFDACSHSDVKYKKYCSTDGFLSVIMNHIDKITESARLYIINSKPILELGIKEKEYVISSGMQVPSDYAKKLQIERRLRDDVCKFFLENQLPP